MKKQVSITKAVKYVINSTDEKHTLLGIGPMSENFLRASLEISKEKDFPLMYIASRNQVDAYKFGGGYVFHADQKKFRDKIEAICEEIRSARSDMTMHTICAEIMVDHGREIKKEMIIFQKLRQWKSQKNLTKKIS